MLIRENVENTEQQRTLTEMYFDELYQLVAGLDTDRFVVKAKIRTITEYNNKTRWESLSQSDLLEINNDLSPLVLPTTGDDELARRFDILLLNYQLAILTWGL